MWTLLISVQLFSSGVILRPATLFEIFCIRYNVRNTNSYGELVYMQKCCVVVWYFEISPWIWLKIIRLLRGEIFQWSKNKKELIPNFDVSEDNRLTTITRIVFLVIRPLNQKFVGKMKLKFSRFEETCSRIFNLLHW